MSDAFDELDALIAEYDEAEAQGYDNEIKLKQAETRWQTDLHRRASVTRNYYKRQFDWQLSIGYALVLYCPICFWGSSNPKYIYCPYHTGGESHGLMSPIQHYLDSTIGDI